VLVEPQDASGTYTAVIDVPAGATDVHFMVVNTGQSDGAYTKMALKTEQAADPTGAGGGGGGGSSSSSGAGGAGANNDDKAVSVVDGGCGCEVPGSSGDPAAAGLLAAMGAALSVLRRRGSRRSSKK
jgi:MYXO-CTERM domain-containing protein